MCLCMCLLIFALTSVSICNEFETQKPSNPRESATGPKAERTQENPREPKRPQENSREPKKTKKTQENPRGSTGPKGLRVPAGKHSAVFDCSSFHLAQPRESLAIPSSCQLEPGSLQRADPKEYTEVFIVLFHFIWGLQGIDIYIYICR